MKPVTKEEVEKQIRDAAVCCCIMELMLQYGENLWLVPADLARQAQEAQRKAQDKKDLGKDKRFVSINERCECVNRFNVVFSFV